jgi:hypothetical protein
MPADATDSLADQGLEVEGSDGHGSTSFAKCGQEPTGTNGEKASSVVARTHVDGPRAPGLEHPVYRAPRDGRRAYTGSD